MKIATQPHVSKEKAGKDLQPKDALTPIEKANNLQYRVKEGIKA